MTRRARVGPVARGAAVKGIDLLSDDDPKRAALQSWLDSDLRLRFAATALHHGLTLVTRNTADIGPTGVPVVNPWRHPTGS